MTAANFPAALEFVWRRGFDSPADGYHVTKGDAGGGTMGGVIEVTWQAAVKKGWVTGPLRAASTGQLGDVLHHEFWGPACDALPPGLDLMLFNGRMMTGRYPHLFQQCLGCVGSEVDGVIGPDTLSLACSRDASALIHALTGVHAAYLQQLAEWPRFGSGWSNRLLAARVAALQMIAPSIPIA